MEELLSNELTELMAENMGLPDKEQLELHAFSLHEEARKRAFSEAQAEASVERSHEDSRSERQCSATQGVLHECWHKMVSKPRCIQQATGDGSRLQVRNFGMEAAPERLLQRELARHELVLSVTRLISFKPWQTMTDSELEQRLNASPLDRRSFKSVAEGIQRLLGELSLAHARSSSAGASPGAEGCCVASSGAEGGAREDVEERSVQSGSTSLRVLAPEQSPGLSLLVPFQQTELNVGAHEAAKHAFLLLVVIRDLKCSFNQEFHQLWILKDKELAKSQEIVKRLKEINNELNDGNGDVFELPQWSVTEKPEIVIGQESSEMDENCSSSQSVSRSEDTFGERTLANAMDNRLETRWQDRLAREPSPPPCLTDSSKLWTDEDREAAELYARRLETLRSEREAYKMKFRQERMQLMTTLNETFNKLDAALKKLDFRRLEVETAVREEELKISRIKLWSLARTQALRHENQVRDALKISNETIQELNEKRISLAADCEAKKKQHEILQAQDRQQAQSFRREFTHLSPMVVDQLTKWYKKRPAVHLTPLQLRRLGQKLCSHKDAEDVGDTAHNEPWRDYISALRNLDTCNSASANVDSVTWNMLCKLRRAKAEAEIKVKASGLELTDCDGAIASLDSCLAAERKRHKLLTSDLEKAIENKRRLLLDTEVQLLLPRGRIELSSVANVEECNSAVVVPLNIIHALNRVIRETGAEKLIALRMMLRFRAEQLRQAAWTARMVEAQATLLQEELERVQRISVSSQIRHFLHNNRISKSAGNSNYEEMLFERRTLKLESDICDLRKQCDQATQETSCIQNEITVVDSYIQSLAKSDSTKESNEVYKLRCAQSAMRRNIQIKSEELDELRCELEKLKLRTFPTLFEVSL